MTKPPGYILYEGPSRLDGSPIVIIINKIYSKSKNAKTGDGIQTWIIRSDMPPMEALRAGHDIAICGDCPARDEWCYVRVDQAVTGIYKAYLRGSYKPWSDELLHLVQHRYVRFGSYGDPAAAPIEVWEPLLAACTVHTAYTHQWRVLGDEWKWCMASCDTLGERDQAKALGWRSFVTLLPGEKRPKGVASCPASKEQGMKLTCEQCGHCDGIYDRGASRIGDVGIYAHGSLAGRYMKWRQLEIELEETA